ncbi:Retrovirus-related Pol polyprotein from transposon 17.6 [Cucumis melo var. makuwa]|uniref:Retrovirus-related Pol polyprotein from transposon 17.6 n=1 Tax=Cucumis melo var. makuwa TaxID=1194695 RepID=A0A5A7TP65_CUCMM|nr:Retrovirus-related Pol polyprotein from transposon 17.6 [Cucumis melo var. makuwa]
MKEVVKKEIIKWLDAKVFYPIAESEWVSLVQYVPKKGEMTVVENEKNEFIPREQSRGGRFEFYCFLDGYSGYNQTTIALEDQYKRCMMVIFSDFLERSVEIFMDDFSVFEDSFKECLDSLEEVLEKCEETQLVLN